MTTKRTQVGLHLDAAMIRDIRTLCAKTGQPMTEFMRGAIKTALKREAEGAKRTADYLAREAAAKADMDARKAKAKNMRRVMIGSAGRHGITYEQLKADGMTDAEIINLGWMKVLAC
jgi:hypothetical protein